MWNIRDHILSLPRRRLSAPQPDRGPEAGMAPGPGEGSCEEGHTTKQVACSAKRPALSAGGLSHRARTGSDGGEQIGAECGLRCASSRSSSPGKLFRRLHIDLYLLPYFLGRTKNRSVFCVSEPGNVVFG